MTFKKGFPHVANSCKYYGSSFLRLCTWQRLDSESGSAQPGVCLTEQTWAKRSMQGWGGLTTAQMCWSSAQANLLFPASDGRFYWNNTIVICGFWRVRKLCCSRFWPLCDLRRILFFYPNMTSCKALWEGFFFLFFWLFCMFLMTLHFMWLGFVCWMANGESLVCVCGSSLMGRQWRRMMNRKQQRCSMPSERRVRGWSEKKQVYFRSLNRSLLNKGISMQVLTVDWSLSYQTCMSVDGNMSNLIQLYTVITNSRFEALSSATSKLTSWRLGVTEAEVWFSSSSTFLH